jgi:hypothetical protein
MTRAACILRRATMVLVGVGFVACSLEHLTRGVSASGASADASTEAARGDASPSDADPDDNLLPNGGFEARLLTCGPWKENSTGGEADAVEPGRESARACRVCARGAQAKLGLFAPGPPLVDGGRYRIEGWMRVASGNPSGDFRLYVDYGVNERDYKGAVAARSPVGTSWQRLEEVDDVSSGMTWSAFFADVLDVEDDVCIELDDIRFSRVGP